MPLRKQPIDPQYVETLLRQMFEMERQTHAGAVIAATSKIEHFLERFMLGHMRRLTKAEHGRLFRNYGPLSSFSAKIDLAYALKIIQGPMYDALHRLRKLRNEFAHSEEPVNLGHPKIKPFFDRFAEMEPAISTADFDVFEDCIYSIGVSLGHFIAERETKNSEEP